MNTQLNVEEQKESKESYSSNEEIVQRDNIGDTPFTVITTEGKSFGTLGKYRITEDAQTKAEIVEELQRFSWNTVLKLLAIIVPEEVKRGVQEWIKMEAEEEKKRK